MSDFKLVSDFSPTGDQPIAIQSLINGIESGQKSQVLLGITGSGKTFTMANVIESVQRPTLILSHNKTLAAQLYGEFKSLFPNNAVEFFISYYDYYQPEAYLPVTDTYIEKDSSINDEIDRLRLRATASLVSRKDVVVVASVSSIYGLGSPQLFHDMLVSARVGERINTNDFFRRLVNIHYNRNDMVLQPGNFRVRGDTIEIFPIYDKFAVRIGLFGDEIESIEYIDPISYDIKSSLNEMYIYPAKHFVTTCDRLNNAIEQIRNDLTARVNELKSKGMLLEAQRLEQRTLYDIEMMMEMGYCSGIENYSRYLDDREIGEKPYTLMDFFPNDFLFFVDESHVSLPQVRAMYNGDRSRKETLIEHGFRLPSALDNRPLKFEEFNALINQVVYVSATPSEFELESTGGSIVEQIIRPTGILDPEVEVHPTKSQIDRLISAINPVIDRGERVLITTLTKKMSEDLTDYLKNVGIRCEYLHSDINAIDRVKIIRGLRIKEFDVLIGINLLREGLDLPEVSMVVVLDADKQGFLRSKTSLLQVSGRAARNINGKVLLFGDQITDAMQSLIDTTKHRRTIQDNYNKENNIIPKTILKSIEEIAISTQVADEERDSSSKENRQGIEDMNYDNLDEIERDELVSSLNKKMLSAARGLKFELATIYRDQINNLKKELIIDNEK